VTLAGRLDDHDILLRDIQAILAELDAPAISTKVLIEKLTEAEDRPWATWRKGDKPITARGLRLLLEPFDIHPDKISGVARG
jgi:hypothetical protein